MKLQLPSLEEIHAELARRSLAEFVRQAWPIIEPTTKLIWNWHLTVVCDHLQALLEGRLGKKNLIINVPPGSMKPCYNGSMITERKLGRIKLSDVKVGDNILTHRGRYRKVLAVHEQGILPLLEIQTASGRALRLAYDHPLLTTRGWVEAQHLTLRDVLAEVHPVEGCGSATTTPQEARLLGYLVGDGCTSQNRAASFTNQDLDAINDFTICAESLGFQCRRVRLAGSKSEAYTIHLKGGQGAIKGLPRSERKGVVGPVRKWVRVHGLEGATSYAKRVPLAVMAATDDLVADFLAAYWACDGGIYDRRDLPRAGRPGQKIRAVRVECSTVSEGLARDLQHLFSRLGMSFVLRKKSRQLKTRRQGDLYEAWYLGASDQDTVAKFMQIISPRMRHEKQSRANGLSRSGFDQILNPDPVRAIAPVDPGECRCLTIEEDQSFAIEDIAVHNSTVVSVAAPAWVWAQEDNPYNPDLGPGWRGLFAAGSDSLALRDSIKCRDILGSEWYQRTFRPSWRFADDQNAKSFYKNSRQGFRKSFSAGATVTGDRGHAIFVDDPLDAKKAFGKPAREEIKLWWDHAFANRLNDLTSGCRCVIMQRLHEDDLVGHILETDPEAWDLLKIRQEFEADPPDKTFPTSLTLGMVLARNLGPHAAQEDRVREAIRLASIGYTAAGWKDPRKVDGALMFPQRFPEDVLASEKKRLGSAGYAGQHQQRPSPASGNLFHREWFSMRTYPLEPMPQRGQIQRIVQSWDTAGKKEQANDYSVCTTWGIAQDGYCLLEVWREKVEFPELKRQVRALAVKWTVGGILIEDTSAGTGLIQELQRETSLPIIPVKPPSTDKVARANQAAPTVEAGRVLLPQSPQPWQADFIEELCTFPSGHDDQVDSVTQFLNWANSNTWTQGIRMGGERFSRTLPIR